MTSSKKPLAERTLPRYGIREDEMTRPCVVLYDWNGDDEATVSVSPLEHAVRPEPPADDLDDFDANLFRPRWRGAGRRPGAAILTAVLGLCVVIGYLALFEPVDAQAGLTNPAPATAPLGR